MSAYEARTALFNRMAVIVALVIVSIRAYQYFTLIDASFTAAQGNPFACFFTVTNIYLAVFILAPLFAFYMLPALHIFKNTNRMIRRKSREGCLYSFALLALAKAAIFSLFVNGSSVPVLLTKVSANVSVGSIVAAAGLSVVLETCFFLVCGLLFFVVFMGTASVAVSAIVLFLYVLWDFITDNVPIYAGTLPVVGWHLTEMIFPFEPFGFFRGFLPLLVLFAMLLCIGMLIIRRQDIIWESKVNEGA